MHPDPFSALAPAPVDLVLTGVALLDRPGSWAVALSHGGVVAIVPAERGGTLGLPVVDVRPMVGESALLTPSFADAHAHVVLTGRAMTGLDLSKARSATDVLAAVATRRKQQGPVLITGQGWDHTHWPEGRPPRLKELDRAADGAPVFLTRVDVHSALVSSALLDRIPGIRDAEGFEKKGWINREAYSRVGQAVADMFTESQRTEQIGAALSAAAAQGLSSVHEMGAPHLNTVEELALTRRVAAELGIDLPAYWGADATPELIDWAREMGLCGLAGDLNADGAIGSRTAAVSGCYHDVKGDHAGFLFVDEERAAQHVIACTRAGLQAGFHCIGDRGVTAAVGGMRRAAEELGTGVVRAARHRLEHVEMASPEAISTMARLGIWGSMQPLFDAWWGRPGGLYEQRLGPRYAELNRFGSMHAAGVPLAFGSDTPVTPFHGWEVVRAAVHHQQESERLDLRTAFALTTASGHEMAYGPTPPGYAGRGVVAVGAPADVALWACGELAPDSWPQLDLYDEVPACVATFSRGRLIHDDRGITEARA